jgi:hypothetical protein
VDWSLPVGVVSPGGSVTVRVDPTTTDGSAWWHNGGPTPPELVVSCQ